MSFKGLCCNYDTKDDNIGPINMNVINNAVVKGFSIGITRSVAAKFEKIEKVLSMKMKKQNKHKDTKKNDMFEKSKVFIAKLKTKAKSMINRKSTRQQDEQKKKNREIVASPFDFI
jgi:hypothetical protein